MTRNRKAELVRKLRGIVNLIDGDLLEAKFAESGEDLEKANSDLSRHISCAMDLLNKIKESS